MNDHRSTAKHTVSAAVALALAAGAGPVRAQEGGTRLEEIIVTATKREENLQKVSMSVTAVGEKQLALAGIEDITRLDMLVPGMRVGQSGDEVRLAIRGSRTNNVGTEAEQVVGIFEDGVYLATTTQALGSYLDVSRVEVLRGPQGTLYGRNTFGGTINIITNQPSFEKVEGYLSLLYGDYDRTQLQGVVNLPVSDTFALRLAGMSDVHDGYIKNLYEPGPGDDLNNQDIQFFRASARWAPTDDFDATLRATYSQKNTNGSAIWGYQQIGGYSGGQYLPGHNYAPPNASDDFDQGPWVVRRDFGSLVDTENFSTTLSMAWDTSFATLKFIGNLTDFQGRQVSDFDYSDGGDPLNSGFAGWDSDQQSWSTELQLISSGDGSLQWLLGVYLFEQDSDWNWLEETDGVLGEPHWDNQGNYVSESTGYFANATYALTDRLRLIGGLRYNEDTKKLKDQLDWSVFPPVTIPNSGATDSWDKTLWKAGAEFDIGDEILGYLTASTGYRAGGINPVGPGIPRDYTPEDVTAYELGVKSMVADGRVRLNVAAYLNQYRDMHNQSFVSLGGAAVTEFVENGGEVDTSGLEVELSWTPDDNWYVGATLALMDAKFGEYSILQVPGLGNIPGRQDLSDPTGRLSLKDWRPALSPEVTASLQLSYDFKLTGGSVLRPYFQTSYVGEYSAHDINVQGQFQDAYTMSDARLVWTSASGKLEIQGFVQNIEDEAVLNRVVVFATGVGDLASLQANWGNPRTWGISGEYRF